MSRKADPILLRTGLNRIWKVNVSAGHSPVNYQYIMQRFDIGLSKINSMLIEFETFIIKSTNKHILQATIFKYFSPKFKDRYRTVYYLLYINEVYYSLIWRRWYKNIEFTHPSKSKAILNYLNLYSKYGFWNGFLKTYCNKRTFYQTHILRYYLQKFFFHNVTGFIIDPLETFDTIYFYKDHPQILYIENINIPTKLLFKSNKKDIKWSRNLARLINVCSLYSHLDFTHILAKFIAREIEKDKRHWPLIHTLRRALKTIERKIKLRSIRIRLIGKLRGARRTRAFNIKSTKWRIIPFMKLQNRIFIGNSVAYTVYGSVGVKVMTWAK